MLPVSGCWVSKPPAVGSLVVCQAGSGASSDGRAAYAWHSGAHAHRLAALRRERPAPVVSPWWGVAANDNVLCAVAAVWCSAGVGPVSTLNVFLGILSIRVLCQAAAPRTCSQGRRLAWRRPS